MSMIFANGLEPQWQQCLLGEGVQRRSRSRSLSLSEIMTSLIAFHPDSAVRLLAPLMRQLYWN